MLAKKPMAALLVLLLNVGVRADNSSQQLVPADMGTCVKLDPLTMLRKYGHTRIGKVDITAKATADGAFFDVVIKGMNSMGGPGTIVHAEKMALEIEEPKKRIRFHFFNKVEFRRNGDMIGHGEGKGLVLTYETTLSALGVVE